MPAVPGEHVIERGTGFRSHQRSRCRCPAVGDEREPRAPTRCGTRFADSTQLLTLVGGAASFVLVEKSRPALDGRRLALLWG
jgi:hypothetical protein